MDPDKYQNEKALVIGVSGVVGVVVFLILRFKFRIYFLLAALGGIATSFSYVFLAASAVEAYISLRSWAYRGRATRPPDNDILTIAALWPFALFGGGLIFALIGIINRRF